MHVLLVGAELEENLAVRSLAASAERAGHRTSFAPFASAEDTEAAVAAVIRERPDVVGLSMTFQRRGHEFGGLAEALRAAGYGGHVTGGGHFPTFAWRAVLERYPAIDTVVRHEGEDTLPELCAALAAGGGPERLEAIAGLAYRGADGALRATRARPLALDLDALPFPKRFGDLQVHLGIPTTFLVGSRGCFGHCTFCCIHAFIKEAKGPAYRARSAGNVAEEIAVLRRTRGARLFVFHDDDFFTRDHAHDLARVTALRDELRARDVDDVAFVVKARPDDVDPDVFRVLREIGLLRVYVGIEAGSTQGLRTLGRGVDMEANRRGLARLRAQDVYTCFNMLIFDPDSRPSSLRASLGFLRENADVPMNFCRTEIYVGTPLERRLAREGRLRGDEFGWDYDIADPEAELAFRLFSRAFLDRNFRCDGLMNSNLGLGYHLYLLKHFYPHAWSPRLHERAIDVIRRVNLDSVTRMEAIVDFSTSPAADSMDARQEYAELATRDALAASEELEELVRTTSRSIVEVARTTRVRPEPARWRRAVAAAAFAFAPLACGSIDGCGGRPLPPPPPDPLPPPQTDPLHPDGGTAVQADGGARWATPPPPDPVPPPMDPLPPPPDPLPPPPDPLPPPDRVQPNDPAPPPWWIQKRPPPPPDPLPPPPDPLPAPHRK